MRAGSFLPSILEPRRRVDQALYAVIMEAYIGGVSTMGVNIDGRRELLGNPCGEGFAYKVGDSETEGFCEAVGSPGHGHRCPAQCVRPGNR